MKRARVDIDPKIIEKLSSTGTKVTEIADIFGVSTDTINRRFAAELAKGRSTLKSDLRKAQISAAKNGNSTMLVWLGKQYLSQSDSMIDQYLIDAIKDAGLTKEDLIDLIKNKDKLNIKPKKSFKEFCETAAYALPYDKQIEMMKFAMNETEPRLLLGSRGYGKTDYAVIMGVAYDIYMDRKSTNLIITKSKERNAAILGEIASACTANGVLFDQDSATRLRVAGLLGKDDSVTAKTLKQSLRGCHHKRVIMDDPVTEDDVSPKVRAQVKRKYNEILKLTTNIVIVGQPVHFDDLYEELRPILKKMEVVHGTIKELDHDLVAMRLAGVDEDTIQASYFLKIVTDGARPFGKIKSIDKFPTGDSAVAFIDPSHEGGDYTALSILKSHMDAIVVVGFIRKRAWEHCLDDFVELIKKYHVKRLCFETNALGDMPIDILRGLVPKDVGVVGRKSTNNKHSRIMAAGAYSHMIHLCKESDKKFLDQVTKYEYGAEFDDAPDSMATCMEWVGLIRGKL